MRPTLARRPGIAASVFDVVSSIMHLLAGHLTGTSCRSAFAWSCPHSPCWLYRTPSWRRPASRSRSRTGACGADHRTRLRRAQPRRTTAKATPIQQTGETGVPLFGVTSVDNARRDKRHRRRRPGVRLSGREPARHSRRRVLGAAVRQRLHQVRARRRPHRLAAHGPVGRTALAAIARQHLRRAGEDHVRSQIVDADQARRRQGDSARRRCRPTTSTSSASRSRARSSRSGGGIRYTSALPSYCRRTTTSIPT